MGQQEDTPLPESWEGELGDQTPDAVCSEEEASGASVVVATDGRSDNALVARGKLVARIGEGKGGLHPLREIGRRGHEGLGAEERTLARMDRLLGAARDPLWARKTLEKHEGILLRFLEWQERSGLGPGAEGKKRGNEARGLGRFIIRLAREVSGEALMTNARSLLRIMERHLEARKREAIERVLPILRREANQRRPPKSQAAEAVSMTTLKRLVERARRDKLSKGERQAIDMFLIAYVTMSRMGEIAALEVENVAADGNTISVRPKTGAKTWLRLTKCVPSARGLRAAERLQHHREAAKRERRKLLFPGQDGKLQATAAITARLRRASKKLGIGERITSHSARKGAAVEAVLQGVPLPVVQALGGWRDLNTLQAYIGEAIRRSTSLMQILEGRGQKRKRMKGS